MSELPAALRPWRPALELFDREVWGELGPWLKPLFDLIGPMARPESAVVGDPDGIHGLARRGPYERLLLSEWAVALELPDEFTRRAAMGEHAFLAPAFLHPKGTRSSVALVDVGPLQLGVPRLVQLAAFVVLRQRAADVGAEFRFGVLQAPQAGFHRVDRKGIRSWCTSRAWTRGDQDIAAWQAILDHDRIDDRWLLGDATLAKAAGAIDAGFVGVTEPLDFGPAPVRRHVRVTVVRRGTRRRDVDLVVPDEPACLRMLRSPLGPRRMPSEPEQDRTPGQVGRLFLGGRRLLMSRSDGTIEGLFVPPAPAMAVGRPKTIRKVPNLQTVGVDGVGRRLVVLAFDRRSVFVVRGSGFDGRTSCSIGHELDTTIERPESMVFQDDALLTLYVTEARVGVFEAWILDHGQQLWRLAVRKGSSSSLTIMERGCRALRRYDNGDFLWVSDSLERVCGSGQLAHAGPSLDEGQRGAVVFGPRSSARDRGPRYAFPSSQGHYVVYGLEGASGVTLRDLPVAPGRPFGVDVEVVRGELHPVLLVEEESKQRLLRVKEGSTELLWAAPSRLERVRFEPSYQLVLARMESGEVVVYNLPRRTVVLSVPRSKP